MSMYAKRNKLTDAQRDKVIVLYERDKMSCKLIARRFDVPVSYIESIISIAIREGRVTKGRRPESREGLAETGGRTKHFHHTTISDDGSGGGR